MHAGADRGSTGGPEGTAGLPGGRTRERAELAGAAGRPQGARPGHRARAGRRRRGARLLEGAGGGLSDDPAPALHRAQDRQCLGQAAELGPAGGQGRPARGLVAGMGVVEVRRLKQLEEENAKLKRLVADLTLDKTMLQDVLRRKW